MIGVVVCALAGLGVWFLRPDPAAKIPPISPASLMAQQWLKRAMPDAYEKIGRRDSKWNKPAREALRLSVDLWGAPRVRGADEWGVYQAARAAVEAGCDDPMVLYAYARTFKTFGDDLVKCVELHQRAADGLPMDQYTAFYKSLAQFRAAEVMLERARERSRGAGRIYSEDWQPIVRRMETGTACLAMVRLEAGMPLSNWIELGDAAMEVGVAREDLINAALPSFELFGPRAAALAFKGSLYTRLAWDARGDGFADTVTDEGWKVMADRLKIAQAALEEAWKLEPGCATIAARMINVELGQAKGRERMELWFKRAMEADPDCHEACDYKLYYLEPRWHGTPDDVIAFGRECLSTGRFRSNVPRTLLRAHEALSHYTRGGRYVIESDPAYFKRPGVWADLKQMYDGYLLADGDVDCTHLRNQYAEMACRCGAWDDAAKMFAVLGDHSDPRVWTAEAFQAARKEATEKGGG